MLIESVAFFLGVSLLLYLIFAGADFGGGILELFMGKRLREEQRSVITHAISPVWEANHVWLILAVVILFVGFPQAYSKVSVFLHIPLTIMLLGIVIRGCAFTFRHYDAVKGDSQHYYNLLFAASSLITPFFLGIVSGALFLGEFRSEPLSFVAVYVWPWLNLFSFAVGLLTCALVSFLAAIYLIGETKDSELKEIFITRAKIANAFSILAGALVFISAEMSGLPLLSLFFADPIASFCMLAATLLLGPLWKGTLQDKVQRARLAVASQVSLILLGWFKLQFPYLILSRLDNSISLSIYNAAAPKPTLEALLIALLVGSALIFPALAYLLWVFKRRV